MTSRLEKIPCPALAVAVRFTSPVPWAVMPLMPLTVPMVIVPLMVAMSTLPLLAVVLPATVTSLASVRKTLPPPLRDKLVTLV